ncbi:MAG: Holliday junction branch migration protein RuvA [Eubacteriales bacterium]
MFYYLSGKITHIEGNLVVVDCQGVGYLCHSTGNTIGKLQIGKDHKLFTYLHVREDAMDIFGFYTVEEKHMFQQLISVSGIGPKAGLGILSMSSPADVALAIITGDEKALTVAPGIGKKIAQRVILELKDKLAKGQNLTLAAGESHSPAVTVIPQNKRSEATAALAVLGYSPVEIAQALQTIDLEPLTLEQIIKEVLKKMMK